MRGIILVGLSLIMISMMDSTVEGIEQNSLAAYWSFDEGKGTVAYDYSGRGYDLKIKGAKWIKGIAGSALSFDGKSCLTVADGSNLDFFFPGDYSLEVWVKQNSKEPQIYISKWTGSAKHSAWWLGYYEEKVQFGDYYDGGQVRVKGIDIADGEWHHIVGVRDGNTLYLYIDGKKVAKAKSKKEVSGNNFEPVRIGCYTEGMHGWPFKGSIDELHVYWRALTEEEIKNRYLLINKKPTEAIPRALVKQGLQRPLTVGLALKKIDLHDVKESLEFNISIIAGMPVLQREEIKISASLIGEDEKVISEIEKSAILERGERGKEILNSFPPVRQGDYTLRVKLGKDVRINKPGIIVRDMDALSKENIQIRNRKKKFNSFDKTVSPYAITVYKKDGYPDIEATIARVKELGANVYTYLIALYPEKELAALPEFCRKASREGIKVWVYLLPTAEYFLVKEKNSKKYPPFDDDYLKWAEAIAKISLKHKNLTHWLIDDFYYSSSPFTVGYTKKIYKISKKINPGLSFGVCVYYSQVKNFIQDGYSDYIDSILWGYKAESTTMGKSVKNLVYEINYYHKMFPDKIIFPCIYVSGRWEPEDLASLEYAIKTAYEQTGIAWLFGIPFDNDNQKIRLVKRLIAQLRKR